MAFFDELTKLSVAIAGEQREIDKNYRTIGEWFVNEYEGEIPGATAKDCGNYKDMDLRAAKAWAERYYALLRTIDEDRLVYPT